LARKQYGVTIQRTDGSLALFLRVSRDQSGIYVMFAAAQGRPRHDPHSSWHSDGRVHHKSHYRMMQPFQRRQPLGPSFAGSEYFVQTSVTRDGAPSLPTCDPAAFDSMMIVPLDMLNPAPNGTQIHVELLGPGATPASPIFQWRLMQRALFENGIPTIAISFYNLASPIAT
jgi:hypothetical protein